jgi:hypothetical protein
MSELLKSFVRDAYRYYCERKLIRFIFVKFPVSTVAITTGATGALTYFLYNLIKDSESEGATHRHAMHVEDKRTRRSSSAVIYDSSSKSS